MATLWIIGAGGHARVIAEVASASGFQIKFIDNTLQNALGEQGFLSLDINEIEHLICGVGSVSTMLPRSKILAKYTCFQAKFTNIIHPSAIIAPSAVLGGGVFVGPRVVINANAKINDHCIINSGAVVEHDCSLGVNCHIASGAVLAGGVSTDDNVMIGSGAVIIQNRVIAKNSVIGAGSVVIKDICESDLTWVGNPARKT